MRISFTIATLATLVIAGCGNGTLYLDAGPIDAAIDAEPPDACVPRTCDSAFRYCDQLDDGCGNTLECGACPAPLTCGIHELGVCGIATADRVCNAASWCWEHPLPFGMDLSSTWSASPTDVWATGAGGTLLRNDGTGWRPLASGTDLDLASVWGTAPNNAYVVGREGYLRRWNGSALVIPPGAPQDISATDVHGSSASDVWVTGDFGAFDYAHFDGSTWTGFANPQFFSPSGLFAISPTDAWAFGFSDTAQHWDGTAWTQTQAPGIGYHAVWATGATDVWAVGGDTHRWNGTAWSTVDLPGEQFAIEGTGATDIWIGGDRGLHHWNGTAWSSVASDATITGVRVHGADDAWAVGRSGRTYTWDGAAWTKRTGFGVAYTLEAVAQISDSELWFIGSGALRWTTDRIEDFGAQFTPQWFDVVGAWGSATDDVWAVGPAGEIAHWNGTTWTMSQPIADLPDLNAVWGTAANDVWAVTDVADPFEPSDASIVHWDGTAWSVVTTLRSELTAVGGSGPNDVWVGGEGGLLHHWNGTQWEVTPPLANGNDIYDIATSPSGIVYLATRNGVFRRTGTTWTTLGLDEPAGSIVIASDTDVWVTLGDRINPTPRIAHFTGVTWTKENTGAGQPVRELAVTATSLFAIGRSGAVLRKAR